MLTRQIQSVWSQEWQVHGKAYIVQCTAFIIPISGKKERGTLAPLVLGVWCKYYKKGNCPFSMSTSSYFFYLKIPFRPNSRALYDQWYTVWCSVHSCTSRVPTQKQCIELSSRILYLWHYLSEFISNRFNNSPDLRISDGKSCWSLNETCHVTSFGAQSHFDHLFGSNEWDELLRRGLIRQQSQWQQMLSTCRHIKRLHVPYH